MQMKRLVSQATQLLSLARAQKSPGQGLPGLPQGRGREGLGPLGLVGGTAELITDPEPLPFPPHRAPCSPSPRPPWSTTPQDSSPAPPRCRAASAVGFPPSAGAARRRPQASRIRWTSRPRRRWARRSRCARRARRRRPTACTSGLCGAPCRCLTASPSPPPPSRPPCPPSPWRRGRATWRTGPGGRTPARGPGPCPGKSPSCKPLIYFPATHSLPFTRHQEVWWEDVLSVGTLITQICL